MDEQRETEKRGIVSTDVRWALNVALVCLLAALVLPTRTDPDLWGHVRFGLDVLGTHTLPQADPYSFTQDRPQIYHEWLGAVLVALAYSVGGAGGLIVLKGGVALAILAGLNGGMQKLHPVAASIVFMLAALGGAPITLSVRPQLWTLLGLLCLLRWLQAGRYQYVPPLFALWANLHGGWVMGLGVLGVWCTATVLDFWRRSRRVAWTLMALPPAAFAATVLTPYGWDLWRFLGETVSLNRADISEWQPLWTAPAVIWVPFALTVCLLLAASAREGTRPSWSSLLVCATLIYGSLRITRVASVATPAMILLLLPSLAVLWPRSGWTFRAPSPLAANLTLLPVALVVGVTMATLAPSLTCIPIQGPWIPDPAAIPVLRQGIDGGRIVTWFDWGEYAYWHLGPRLKVSMDGRRETIYSDKVLATHYAIYSNREEGHAWLTAQRPEYVWLKSKHEATRNWLAAHDYRIDWSSDRSYVAVRSDLPMISGSATITSTGCFPGP